MIRIKVTWPLALVLLAILALLILRRPPERHAPAPTPSPASPRPRSHRRAAPARPTVIDGSVQESADREVADRARRAYEAAADSPFADALQLLKSRRHARVHANA
jgi:hypothetical protein